jgi:hypothetical protein
MTRSKFLTTLFGIATAPLIPIKKLITFRPVKLASYVKFKYVSCWIPKELSDQLIKEVEKELDNTIRASEEGLKRKGIYKTGEM